MHTFYSNQIAGNEALLNLEETQHALKTLRHRQGDVIHVADGEGNLFSGNIEGTRNSCCVVSNLQRTEATDTLPKLHIFMALPKNLERFEWFLEKVTEIGVGEITPLISHRSEKFFAKQSRWNKILVSAMKQSGRLYLPKLNEPKKFSDAINTASEKKLIAHCIENISRKTLPFQMNKDSVISVFIGPEGDFTPEEVSTAESAGFESVSLGESRLRTETAGVVACVLLNI